MNKKILVMAITDLSKSPRPIRQIKALKNKNVVDTIGLKASGLERKFYKLNKIRLILNIKLRTKIMFLQT